ncbi:hypothetical protein [Microvirga arabica]|nr:hypothetical protein [Microvirga arabica]
MNVPVMQQVTAMDQSRRHGLVSRGCRVGTRGAFAAARTPR